MAGEVSFPWGGSTIGDARRLGDVWFNYYLTAMCRIGAFRDYGVLYTTHTGYSGLLAPTNPAGTTLRMASGAALNVRFLYLNDANIDFSCSISGFYRLVIRWSYSEKTIRATLLGPNTQGWPSPIHTNQINDIGIARVSSDGASLTIYDDRLFFRNVSMPAHSGESLEWRLPNISHRVRGTVIECGAVTPETPTPTSDLPREYPLTTTPVVLLSAYGDTTNACTKLVNETSNTVDLDYYVNSTTGLTSIFFLSFGMRRG